MNPGEECDDGNCDGEDECTLACRAARCGDGVRWRDVEECDDGNAVGGDGCEPDCRVTPACGAGALDARFGAPVSAVSPLHPSRSVTTDLDGDGRMDFVVTTWATRGLSLYLDPAGRGLTAPARMIQEASTTGVATGDLDGDGAQDLAVTVGSVLRVFFGDGTGAFPVSRDLGTFGDARTLLAADLDGDSRDEIVGAEYAGNRVFVLDVTGDRTLRLAAGVTVGVSPASLAVGDLDRDGHLDVIAGNASDMTISMLLGAGDGSLRERTPRLAAGYRPTSLVLADVTCDGILDVVASSYQNHLLAVHFGQPDGSFAAPRTEATDGAPTDLHLADVDGNGDPDVVLAMAGTSASPGALSVRLSTAPGLFAAPEAVAVAEPVTTMAAADFDRDGAIDLMSGNDRSVSLVLQAR